MRWNGENFYKEQTGRGRVARRRRSGRGSTPTTSACLYDRHGGPVRVPLALIQTAKNSVAARKILEGKGVAHYRGLYASHVDRKKEVV